MKPSLSRSNILKASLTIVHENPHLTPYMTPYTAPTSSLPPGHPVHSWPSSGSGTQGTRLFRSDPGRPPSSGRAPEVAKRDRSLFCSRDIFIFLILFQYRNDSLNLLFWYSTLWCWWVFLLYQLPYFQSRNEGRKPIWFRRDYEFVNPVQQTSSSVGFYPMVLKFYKFYKFYKLYKFYKFYKFPSSTNLVLGGVLPHGSHHSKQFSWFSWFSSLQVIQSYKPRPRLGSAP